MTVVIYLRTALQKNRQFLQIHTCDLRDNPPYIDVDNKALLVAVIIDVLKLTTIKTYIVMSEG